MRKRGELTEIRKNAGGIGQDRTDSCSAGGHQERKKHIDEHETKGKMRRSFWIRVDTDHALLDEKEGGLIYIRAAFRLRMNF